MLIEQFYREDLTALREDLEAMEQILRSARQDEWKEILEGNSELRDLLSRFDSHIVKELKRARKVLEDVEANANAEGLAPFGLFLAATAQSLQSGAESLEAALMAMESPPPRERGMENVNRLLSWVRGQIFPVVSRIVGGVWKILINILPPRSWRVRGGIGSAFPGLTEGELLVDFGVER